MDLLIFTVTLLDYYISSHCGNQGHSKVTRNLVVCMEIYTKQVVFQKMSFEMLLKAMFSYCSEEFVSI